MGNFTDTNTHSYGGFFKLENGHIFKASMSAYRRKPAFVSQHMHLFGKLKSGIFGQTAKFGQRPCLFHITNIGIKIN